MSKSSEPVTAEQVLKGKSLAKAAPEGIERFSHAIKANCPDDFVDQFGKLQSNEERTDFIWKQPVVDDIIKLEPEYCAKSSTEASKFRQNGNKYFQKKAYLSAIKEYSKSIIQAPRQSTIADQHELPLAFANRSAALFHLKKYALALKDIEFAFEHGYPEDLQYKLYDRQGKCHFELGQKAAALQSFAKANESLQSAKLEEKYLEIWKNNLQKELAKCEKLTESTKTPKEEDTKRREAPKFGTQVHEKYPKASPVVDIQYNSKDGRHAIAGDDIRCGEVVVIEKTFASVLYEEYHQDHCYNCFQGVFAPIPCFESSSVIFCSRECRDQAWSTYQKYEYKYAALLEGTLCGKMGHLALRLIMEAGLENVLSHVRGVENKGDLEDMSKVGLNKEGIYEGGYASIYHMLSHSEKRKVDDLFDMAVMACFLLRVLVAMGYLKQGEENLETDDNLKLLGGALLKHLCIIQCNGSKVMEISIPSNFHDPKPVDIGIGMYPTAALFNHSCDPVLDVCHYGNTVTVRAIRKIDKDQDLTVSYGPTFYDDHEFTRRAMLKANYFFDCKCLCCEEGWPMWLEMDNQRPEWLCVACGKMLLSDKLENRKFACCKKCSHRQNMEEALNNLGTSHDMYSQCMAEALNGRYDNALPGLIGHLELQQKCINQPWRDFVACQVAIKHCFRMMANVNQD